MSKTKVNSQTLINQLRSEPSAPNAFRTIPLATDNNVAEVANGFLTNPEVKEYFWQALVNRIALTVIKTSRFSNPYNRIRKSDVAIGQTIQEIFIKICEEKNYTQDDPELLLATENPNIDALYFILNRKKYFEQTIFDVDLRWYFSSWEQLDSFIAKVIEGMIVSDEIHEYEYCKDALAVYATKGLYYNVHIDPVIDETSGTNAIQKLQAYALNLGYPSDKYNARRNMQTTPIDRLILFVSIDFETKLSSITQSKVFQLDKAEYLKNRIIVDNFGSNNIQAVLCSEEFLNLRNYLVQSGAFYNTKMLGTNYFYHHHEYIYTSELEPAIAFTTDPVGDDAITSVTVVPSTATLSKGATMLFKANVVYTGNATKNVIWSITGQLSTDTVINTRTGMLYISNAETAETITVTATSEFDDTKTSTSTVTIP